MGVKLDRIFKYLDWPQRFESAGSESTIPIKLSCSLPVSSTSKDKQNLVHFSRHPGPWTPRAKKPRTQEQEG